MTYGFFPEAVRRLPRARLVASCKLYFGMDLDTDRIWLVLGAVVGTLWCMVVFLRGGLLAGCAAVLLAGIVFGQRFFSLATPLFPLTADRLLTVLLVAQYLLWRRLGWTLRKPLTAADYLVTAFLLVLAVSTMNTTGKPETGNRCRACCSSTSCRWCVLDCPASGADGRGAMRSSPVLRPSVFTWHLRPSARLRGLTAFVVPSYIASPRFPMFLGRGRGPFLNPAGNGMAMAICLAAGCMWWQRSGRSGRSAIVCFNLAMLLGIYSTYTRCAWMGGLCGLVVAIAAQLPRGWRMRFVAGVVLAGALLVAAQWESMVAFKRDKGVAAERYGGIGRVAPLLARVAWNMFLDHPLFGVGLGHYMDHNTDYTTDHSVESAVVESAALRAA